MASVCVKGEFSELLNEEFGSSPNKYILAHIYYYNNAIMRKNNIIMMKT